MPPPKPSTEGNRDRHVGFEIGQITRALRERGPLVPDDLAQLVGAEFWEPGRFDRALNLGISDGMLVRQGDGTLAAA